MKSLSLLFSLFLALSATGQKKTGDFHLDKQYTIGPTGTVKLKSSDADVLITGSIVQKNAHVKIDRVVTTKGMTIGEEEFAIDVSEENGDLEIRERSNSRSVGVVGYHEEKYTILIEVPEGTSLLVRGDDGDYTIRNINGSISLDLDDADVILSQCSGSKFEFRMDDGDIKMDEAKGSIEITGDDSDIEIKNAHFTSLNATVDDGDLVIETSLADNGEYLIDAQDGLIYFIVTKGGGKFDVRHDDGRISTEGNFSTEEKTDNRTKLSVGSGSAKVSIRADDARVRLIQK